MRLALLTPARDYAAEWAWAFDVEAAALREAGAEVVSGPWTELDGADGFDLVLPLVTWGYHLRHAEWLAFLDRAEAEGWPMINPPALLRWNSDKCYLAELGRKGIASVPTLEVDHLNEAALTAAHGVLGTDELVIKPPVSAAAFGTYRLGKGDPVPADVHGRRMLIQPWLGQVVDEGEYSLILFGGEYSHTLVKRPQAGDFRVQPDHGGSTERTDCPDGALDLAKAALAAAPAPATYARVDLVRGNDGALQLMELELIEPALFLHCVPEATSSFAAAILAAASAA
ncbi:ATP-grasp domain protein [Sphingomonas rosea]|uniref:ATP-grasp domain protein n=1 Tax=Sphingomonas rosea TaxID=335605 RepID=A0ABP7TY92_9SPHN